MKSWYFVFTSFFHSEGLLKLSNWNWHESQLSFRYLSNCDSWDCQTLHSLEFPYSLEVLGSKLRVTLSAIIWKLILAEFDMTLWWLYCRFLSCFTCSERRIEVTPILLFIKDLVAATPNKYLRESNCLEI